ncbi:unnamed protein product [Pieris brassicae]|uniref:Cadherin domain-containing protein n=1 Tax=Pieris brassicae TaxID=7116 RepID=A0A9P0X7M6_PIEBR|nr:unnamed protein product [Pieris brassicae]
MPKMERRLWLDCIVFIQLMHLCFACQMEGVSNWRLRVEESILDTHNGVVLNRSTSDIISINTIVHSEGLNRGPYIDVKYENSRFIVATTANFAEYEEHETSKTMRVTVSFNCAQGSTNQPPLIIQIDIVDTNQNAPRFLPTDNYEFTVIPPLPPGFLVTGCDNQIIARDIDLTTQGVDFTIEENDYFEIFYDSSPATKEFSATLRAKMFIRSIPDDLSLKIMATDIDETNDPPLTTEGTVRIISDTQFQLPEDLQFSKTFYLMNYTNENLVTDEYIFLTRGYDNQVKFSFEGEHSEYFGMTTNENRITFQMKTEIPTEILREQQIYLIVRAEREHTSGAAATIIIQLPTARELSFELLSYKGIIDGINFVHQDIFLNQGYNEDVIFGIRGDHANLFNHTNNENQLIISLRTQLPQEIVNSNNILTLEITASGDYANTAVTTLIFEIIKDDLTTPVFAKKIYEGKYVNSTLVTIEEISLSQGYDGTVDFEIFGEHAEYFRIENDDDNVIVSLRYAIPEDLIFSAKIFTLYIVATKPNTVGGMAALVIRFPNELTELAVMEFSKHTYVGTLENKAVSIENVILESGFTNQVRFILSGEYYNYFTYSTSENVISILASEELHQNLGNEDNIILNVRAERVNAIPVTTSVVISIVKKEIIQPVFENPYYKGIYTENVGLQFNNVIKLRSGFDVTVTFDLQGEHSQWFYITETEDSVILHANITNSVPNDFIMNNKLIVLTIIANKPEAIAGRTVIVVELNAENKDSSLSFERVYYVGSLDKNKITLDTINLRGNLDEPYTVTLHGDLANYFSTSSQGDGLGIILKQDLPEEGLPDDNLITLEIRATRNTNIAQATVVLKIIKEIDDTPTIKSIRFNRAYYTGQYSADGLSFTDIISLSGGFDDTVEFNLDGESSQWFYITQDGNSVRLYENSTNTLPNHVVASNNQIAFTVLANKPGTVSAESAVLIEFIKEVDDAPTIKPIRFNRAYYTGQYSADGLSFTDIISLSGGFDDTVEFNLDGESSQWFYITQDGNSVRLYENSTNTLPNHVVASNNQIAFTVLANKPGTVSAESAVLIEFIKEVDDAPTIKPIRFNRAYYTGQYSADGLSFTDIISLSGGFDDTVEFNLDGESSQWFYITQDGNSVRLYENSTNTLPNHVVASNNQIAFTVLANKPGTVSAESAVLIEFIKEVDDAPTIKPIRFNRAYYTGQYSADGLSFTDIISLSGGFDDTVEFNLDGESSQWFYITQDGNSVRLYENSTNTLPNHVVASNNQIAFTVLADKPGAVSAEAAIFIEILQECSENLRFDRAYYVGSLNKTDVTLDAITLIGNYDDTYYVTLHGNYASYFSITPHRPVFEIVLQREVSEDLLINDFITFEIRLSKNDVITARTTTILRIIKDNEHPVINGIQFDRVYYVGRYTSENVFTFENTISLAEGYDESVTYSLYGDQSTWFELDTTGSSAKLTLSRQVPSDVVNSYSQLIFEVHANRASDTASARSTIIITIEGVDDGSTPIMKFERQAYVGTISQGDILLDPIVLAEGYNDEVKFSLIGELNSYFNTPNERNVVTLTLLRPIPEENIPINRLITIDIQATSEYTSARAAIVLKIVQNEQSMENLNFDKPYYSGTYRGASEFSFDFIIRMESGFDEAIQFKLEGDHSTWFRMRQSGNSAQLELSFSIPESVINNNNQLVFVVYAQRVGSEVVLTRSVIIIALTNDPITNVKFDKVLYLGRVENNAVVHEAITVVEFSGNVQVSGEYSQLFTATITNGVVTVTLSATSVPSILSYVTLKLVADEASAVLLLDIYKSDTPVERPSLSFSSSSYILEANEGSTGEVGRVSATADNGETVIYSLEIENEHLKQRLTVNSNGEIHLSASANLGVYSFKAIARTRISQVSASAAVQLTIVELGTTINLPPLLVLERDEEEPHLNLVPLDRTKYPNCEYSLSNKWPLDQNWLYVDSEGLHTRSIDREHDSIAFMPVSQVQVELNLNCNKRSKRSNVENRNYGSNKWILTDSISYNPSRTLVNLIVRDINDNTPKFEADSVTVGYPSGDLAEIVLPRAIAELKATDADIEENALLRYMTSDERFVVSPTTGSVHLRNRVTLEDNTRLVVDAVDRNGTGLKGSVEITVRLLDRNQIAVLTVSSRFLDDEMTILDELSKAVGYDVKPLRTTVISESRYDNEGDKSRMRRDVNTNGASLRLYVYGLKQREPVDVTQLTDDLSNTIATVSLARILSLEDHLDELQICPAFEREIGLLAATILLAVLLLIIIVAFGVWFYLRRKIANDYDQFSDQNSLRSRNDSIESPKVEPVFTTPRLIGIEELRKSEKKLQERLDAPKEVPEKPSSKNFEIIDIAETDSKWPIVIQSIDKLKDNADESDNDEFGEKVRPRRKSVVTFNENVEKIIHLEDVSVDCISDADVEVHKF